MVVIEVVKKLMHPRVQELKDSILDGQYTRIEDYREAVGALKSFTEMYSILAEAKSKLEDSDDDE